MGLSNSSILRGIKIKWYSVYEGDAPNKIDYIKFLIINDNS